MTTAALPAASVDVVAEVAAVPRARAEALRWLTSGGRTLTSGGRTRTVTAADVDAVATAVTELVANAVTHGGPPVRLDLLEAAGVVSLTVTDGGRSEPPPATVVGPPAPDAPFGRGLVLVRDVVDELTVVSEGAGTRVRAVRRLGDPPT